MIRAIHTLCTTQAEIVASTLEEMGATVVSFTTYSNSSSVMVWVRHHKTDPMWARSVLIEINKRLKFSGERQLESLTL